MPQAVSQHSVSAPTTVATFADGLFAVELPELAADRRHAAVEFVTRRVRVLPSFTRFGVLTIAACVHGLGMIIGHDRARSVVLRLPLPLVEEYPRLVRSLGFAYVWENWPDTQVNGATP